MEKNILAGAIAPGGVDARLSVAGYASLHQMQAWANELMASRPHDFTIGNDYMRRWWVIPRSEWCNVYLHNILHSDDDRAFHDHPWPSTSFLIAGCYIEHTPEGQFVRRAGDVVSRPANALHRIELFPGKPAISLFITGPKEREWGFACPKGWVHWTEFCDPDDPGKRGRGCGEHEATP